jgi:hypothetical protein
MKTNDTEYIQPALGIIAHYDPDTFKAMNAADWYISVVDEPDDLAPLIPHIGLGEAYGLVQSLSNANGVTIVPNKGETDVPAWAARRPTWINRDNLREDAANGGFNEARYLAYTLVHEFVHHNGVQDEPTAYDAGKAFALRMGDTVLAQSADKVKYRVLQQEQREAMIPDFLRDLYNRYGY